MNRPDASPIKTFTPPGCKLDGATCIDMLAMLPGKPVPAQLMLLGVATWL